MNNFFPNFFLCLILCAVGTFFFGGLLLSNIWCLTVFFALFLAGLITVFSNQESRIEQLEKKVEQLSEDKQNKTDQ